MALRVRQAGRAQGAGSETIRLRNFVQEGPVERRRGRAFEKTSAGDEPHSEC